MEENGLPPDTDDLEALVDFVTGKRKDPMQMQVEICGDFFTAEDSERSFDGSLPAGYTNESISHVNYSRQVDEYLKDGGKHEVPFTCSYCGTTLHGLSSYGHHLELHQSGIKHRCEICGATFLSKSSLKEHMHTHSYTCVFCDQIFQEKHAFLAHVREHTMESAPEELENSSQPEVLPKKGHKRPYATGIFKCSRCGTEFPKKYLWKKHMATHRKEDKDLEKKPRVKTKNTAKASRLEDVIKNVRSQNRDKSCTCSTCGESFPNKNELQRHELLHTNIETFVCEVCGKPFAKPNYLKIHMKMHARREMYRGAVKEGPDFSQIMPASERSYKSRVCERDFWLKEDTFQHSRVPVKHRPFACVYCNKTFMRRSDLNRHEKGHTNEKLYHCQFCNKAFSRKDNLATHMKIYTQERPHKCAMCDKAFTRKSDMHQHMNTHRKQKPFACDYTSCNKTFTRRSDLLRHKRQVHKLESPPAF